MREKDKARDRKMSEKGACFAGELAKKNGGTGKGDLEEEDELQKKERGRETSSCHLAEPHLVS